MPAQQLSQVVKTIEQREIKILSTGFRLLDTFLDGGFFKKEFIAIGAPTGKGKSLLAGSLFKNIAMQNYKCAYFSLEIANEMIVSRLLGADANLSPTRIMIKALSEADEFRKEKAHAELSTYEDNMFFYDDMYELEKIVAEIKKNEYDLVVVDFLQLVQVPKIAEENPRLTAVANQLQQLAKEKDCCIIGVSQLSNQMVREKRDDLVEFKGSGSIGIACDLGFFIEKAPVENMMALRLRKNRRGFSGELFPFYVKTPGGLIFETA